MSVKSKSISLRPSHCCTAHNFTLDEISNIRNKLLKWYDVNQRGLPWRQTAKSEKDDNIRGYSTWVSETMLQQTQVTTVIDYYKKWMKKWPTVDALASSTLDEVNKTWAGLGYYSRARRLYEGAQTIVRDMNGNIPQKASKLLDIPGIGRYTAAAVASIAYGEIIGIVDGNVSRVLSRVRVIGKDVNCSAAVDKLWNLSGDLVSPDHPGDFNQALMELGATVCTPRNPNCEGCPLKGECLAFKQVENQRLKNGATLLMKNKNTSLELKQVVHEVQDIEDVNECTFCLSKQDLNLELGVCCYPIKAAKKQARKELVTVVVIECREREKPSFIVVQRPKTGLLANLWEFPSMLTDKKLTVAQQEKAAQKWLKGNFGLDLKLEKKGTKVGDVIHLFSHIHTTYQVYHAIISTTKLIATKENITIQWLTESEFQSSAVSTAMKKVFRLVSKKQSSTMHDLVSPKRKKHKLDQDIASSNKTITTFFSKKL